jgi:hypothetical protein
MVLSSRRTRRVYPGPICSHSNSKPARPQSSPHILVISAKAGIQPFLFRWRQWPPASRGLRLVTPNFSLPRASVRARLQPCRLTHRATAALAAEAILSSRKTRSFYPRGQVDVLPLQPVGPPEGGSVGLFSIDSGKGCLTQVSSSPLGSNSIVASVMPWPPRPF